MWVEKCGALLYRIKLDPTTQRLLRRAKISIFIFPAKMGGTVKYVYTSWRSCF
jgi:hypothetical protein